MLAMSRKQRGFQRSATFLTASLPADIETNREKGRLKFLYPTKLAPVIADGIEGSSMPAWKNVMMPAEIDAVVAYVARAFAKPDKANTQRRASL